MAHTQPLADSELHPINKPFLSEKPKLRKYIQKQGLTGLANDTKWNELITHMRNSHKEWLPSFRFNCINSNFISTWDCEWYHHLPFPFMSVSWFEISFIEEIPRGNLMKSIYIDHSEDLIKLLKDIGFEFEKGKNTLRIFGYNPRNYIDFQN